MQLEIRMIRQQALELWQEIIIKSVRLVVPLSGLQPYFSLWQSITSSINKIKTGHAKENTDSKEPVTINIDKKIRND